MIEVSLKVTLICKCGCRSIYGSENKTDNGLSLLEQAYIDGWIFNDNDELICPFCRLTK